MRFFVRGLAIAGLGMIIATAAFLYSTFKGPTLCQITGTPIRLAAPVAASPNRDLVVRFYTDVILNGHLDRAGQYLRTDYIQHNPDAGQGLSGFVTYFEQIKRSLESKGASRRGEITMAMAEGDLVVVHVTSVIEGRITASFRAIDIFRVEDGKIAEHWDTIQPCDTRSALLLASTR